MRQNVLIVASLCVLAACSQPRDIRSDDTQVVAQWVVGDPTSAESRFKVFVDAATSGIENMTMENRIDQACGELCDLDGNDIGSGTYNLYLYTENVSATVKLLVQLEKSGRIHNGLRIGVAKYLDKRHQNWTYEAVYPPALKAFDLIYKTRPQSDR
ncbi:MAG TPA: hypothetical protein VGG10_05165 [Rhizomicrobium sp.]|jgi:hypothetical protein